MEEKKEVQIGILEDTEEKMWKSCCIVLDPEFTQFFVKYLILVMLMVFFGIELHLSDDCHDRNLFQTLLSLCIGIAIPSPRLK